MQRQEFLEPYNRDLSPGVLNRYAGGFEMSESRYWGHMFGQVLHDYIAGKKVDVDSKEVFDGRYPKWLGGDFNTLRTSVDATDSEKAYQINNELNFHTLNHAMLAMWIPIIKSPNDFAQHRNAYIGIAQDALALTGLHYCKDREQVAGPQGEYKYFSKENYSRRLSFEGRLNEFDAGIILLEAMRKNHDLIVVPAPLQFEKESRRTRRGAKSKSNNVDFVAIRGDQAVGLQVKARAYPEDLDRYNLERVVIIDGGADMGNERTMRIRQSSTIMSTVAWGGMISAERVADIPTLGKHAVFFQEDSRGLLQHKMYTRSLLRNASPYMDRATEIVTNRLMRAFEK